jgi:hypothetical protein
MNVHRSTPYEKSSGMAGGRLLCCGWRLFLKTGEFLTTMVATRPINGTASDLFFAKRDTREGEAPAEPRAIKRSAHLSGPTIK